MRHGAMTAFIRARTPMGVRGVNKYTRETAKSAFEQGANHIYDRKNFDLGSHMLKHAIECHG